MGILTADIDFCLLVCASCFACLLLRYNVYMVMIALAVLCNMSSVVFCPAIC